MNLSKVYAEVAAGAGGNRASLLPGMHTHQHVVCAPHKPQINIAHHPAKARVMFIFSQEAESVWNRLCTVLDLCAGQLICPRGHTCAAPLAAVEWKLPSESSLPIALEAMCSLYVPAAFAQMLS